MVGGQGAASVALASASTVEWVAAVATAIAAVTAIVLGLGPKDWWLRPKLVAKLRRDPNSSLLVTSAVRIPDIGAVPMVDVAMCLRLYVRNKGRSSAAGVRVALLRVEVWVEKRRAWEAVQQELEGREFVWSATDGSADGRLARRSERPLDILHIRRAWNGVGPRPIVLRFAGTPPPNEAHYLHPPRVWRLMLELSAEHAATRTRYLTIEYDGSWPVNLHQNLGVTGPRRRQKRPPKHKSRWLRPRLRPSPSTVKR